MGIMKRHKEGRIVKFNIVAIILFVLVVLLSSSCGSQRTRVITKRVEKTKVCPPEAPDLFCPTGICETPETLAQAEAAFKLCRSKHEACAGAVVEWEKRHASCKDIYDNF